MGSPLGLCTLIFDLMRNLYIYNAYIYIYSISGTTPVKISIENWKERNKDELERAKFNFFELLKEMIVRDLISKDVLPGDQKNYLEGVAYRILNGEQYRTVTSSNSNTIYDVDSLARRLLEVSRCTKDNSCLFLIIPSELQIPLHSITQRDEELIRKSQMKIFLKAYPDISTGNGCIKEATVRNNQELRDATRSFLTDEENRAHRKIIFLLCHGEPGVLIFRNTNDTVDLTSYYEFVENCLNKLDHKPPITHIVGAHCFSHTGDPKYYSTESNLRICVLPLTYKDHDSVLFEIDQGFESRLLELNKLGSCLVDISWNESKDSRGQGDNLTLNVDRSLMTKIRTRITRFVGRFRRLRSPIQETTNDSVIVTDFYTPKSKQKNRLSRLICSHTSTILSQPCSDMNNPGILCFVFLLFCCCFFFCFFYSFNHLLI